MRATAEIPVSASALEVRRYPHGENVLVEESIAQSMYFVMRGQLFSMSHLQPQLYRGMRFTKGDYFGEKGVSGYSVGVFSVRTLRACDLLSLSSEAFLKVLYSHPLFSIALCFTDQAMQHLRVHPDVKMKDAETRWGQAVVEVIRRKREECEASVSNPAIVFLALKVPEAAFGAFRPLLELVVPNGLLGSYEMTQKVSTFSRANFQNPTVSSTTAEMNLPPVATKKVASTSANGVDEDSESQNLKTVGDSIDDLAKSVTGDDETQTLLNSVSVKLESAMVSAGADLLPANTSSGKESNHLLRSATPTFAHSLASAFGRRTLISSSTHRLSNSSITLLTHLGGGGGIPRYSETSSSLAARLEESAALRGPSSPELGEIESGAQVYEEVKPEQASRDMEARLASHTDSFRGMTPSPTPSHLASPTSLR